MIDIQINAEEEFDYIDEVADSNNFSEGKLTEEPMEDEVEILHESIKFLPPIREMKIPIPEKYKNKTLGEN